MLANSPHPAVYYPVGLLDLTSVLYPSPPLAQAGVCSNLPPLDYLVIAARLAELYESIFPQHPDWLAEIVDWKDEKAVARSVERFLTRVGKLFPVDADLWEWAVMENPAEALEVIQWRLYTIPVCPMGFDIWYHGWDELLEPAPYLLHIEWSRPAEERADGRSEFQQQYPAHPVPRRLELTSLVETLSEMGADGALPEPLAGLPDLIEMLTSSTGNPWLDVGEISLMENGSYLQWDPVEVEMLAEEWRKARPILDRVYALLNWHNETAEAKEQKITAVQEALLEAYRRQEPGYLPQLTMTFAQETPDE
jgi:hypothetical protein